LILNSNSYIPLKASYSYVLAQTGKKIVGEIKLDLNISKKKEEIKQSKDIMMQFYRLQASEILKKAVELGEKYKYQEARDVIDEYIFKLEDSIYHSEHFLKQIRKDLEYSKKKFRNHYSWHKGGHAFIRDMFHAYLAKRGFEPNLSKNTRQKEMKIELQRYLNPPN
jgi:hypothetical protein